MQFIIYRFRGMKNRNSKEQKKEKKKETVILMKMEKLKQEKLPCHQFVSQGKVTENIALNKIYIY